VAKEPRPTVVPKLRFPEFRHGEKWNVGSLADLAEFVNEKTPLSNVSTTEYVSTENLLPDCGGVIAASKLPTVNSVTRYRVGDILISNIRPYLKKVWHADRNGGASNDVIVVRAQRSLSSAFLASILKADSFIAYVMLAAKGVKMPRGDVASMRQYLFGYPGVREQQKIADCLASLDELIAAQGRKVDALNTYKSGLMQQLFPREGETVPRLRFPQFRDGPDWSKRKLNELARRGSGHTPSRTKSEYYNGGIKWVSLADSQRLDSGYISETSTEISEQGIVHSSAVLHAAGSVILCRDAGIGKCAILKETMAVSQHFIVWACNTELLSNWFLYYLFRVARPLFERVASGSTIKTIGLPFFDELSVVIPPLAEQGRIAGLLAILDAQIAAESKKLEALKTHKRGLMQQLFPSPAGV
jgi:type I restriction enzyme S subunit